MHIRSESEHAIYNRLAYVLDASLSQLLPAYSSCAAFQRLGRLHIMPSHHGIMAPPVAFW